MTETIEHATETDTMYPFLISIKNEPTPTHFIAWLPDPQAPDPDEFDTDVLFEFVSKKSSYEAMYSDIKVLDDFFEQVNQQLWSILQDLEFVVVPIVSRGELQDPHYFDRLGEFDIESLDTLVKVHICQVTSNDGNVDLGCLVVGHSDSEQFDIVCVMDNLTYSHKPIEDLELCFDEYCSTQSFEPEKQHLHDAIQSFVEVPDNEVSNEPDPTNGRKACLTLLNSALLMLLTPSPVLTLDLLEGEL